MLDFSRRLVGAINDVSTVGDTTRVGVTAYSYRMSRVANLTDNLSHAALDARIAAEPYQGSITRMYRALQVANAQFNDVSDSRHGDAQVSRSLVLFTDGEPFDPFNMDEESNATVIQYIEREFLANDIFVYVLGLHLVNDAFVNHVRSMPFGGGGFIDTVADISQFETEQVLQALAISCEPTGDFFEPRI